MYCLIHSSEDNEGAGRDWGGGGGGRTFVCWLVA